MFPNTHRAFTVEYSAVLYEPFFCAS